MHPITIMIINQLILIAGVIAIVRFRKINRVYYPFLYLIWLGCINELLGTILLKLGHGAAVNNNIYVLAEALLLLWFFRNINNTTKYDWYYITAGFFFTIIWGYENLYMGLLTC